MTLSITAKGEIFVTFDTLFGGKAIGTQSPVPARNGGSEYCQSTVSWLLWKRAIRLFLLQAYSRRSHL